MSKKLFRFHRGLLADSLATTIEVMGLTHLIKEINAVYPKGHLRNIRIKNEPINDFRLPEEWNGVSYYVVADFDGYEGQCIGMSNFYEEVYISQCTDDGKCGYQVTTDCEISVWDKRTAEERKADEAKAKKSAFLAELKELLAKYDAKITIGNDGYDTEEEWLYFEVGGQEVYYTHSYKGGFDFPLTADNINDYDKEEV